MQPHPSKGELRLHYDKLPVATELRGRFGNQLWAVRYDEGSDISLRVLIDGEVKHHMSVGRGDFQWHSFRLPINLAETGKSITFVISAPDATWRQACLDARLLGAAKARTKNNRAADDTTAERP